MSKNNEIKFLFQKAEMAYKAKRYEEAQTAYEDCLKMEETPSAWLGLAKSKIDRIPDGQTIQEVTYCIDNAKKLVNKKSNISIKDIDDEFIGEITRVLDAYTTKATKQLEEIWKLEKEQAVAAAAALVTGTVAAASKTQDWAAKKGTSKTTWAAAGAAAGSTAYAVGKHKQISNSKDAVMYTISFFEEISAEISLYFKGRKDSDNVKTLLENLKKYKVQIACAHPLQRKTYIDGVLNIMNNLIKDSNQGEIPAIDGFIDEKIRLQDKLNEENLYQEKISTDISTIEEIVKESKNLYKEIKKNNKVFIKEFKEQIVINILKHKSISFNLKETQELDDSLNIENDLEKKISECGTGFLSKAKALPLEAKLQLQKQITKSKAKEAALNLIEKAEEDNLAFPPEIKDELNKSRKEFNSFEKEKNDRISVIYSKVLKIAKYYNYTIDDGETNLDKSSKCLKLLRENSSEKKKIIDELKSQLAKWSKSTLFQTLNDKKLNVSKLGVLNDHLHSLPKNFRDIDDYKKYF